MLSNRTLLLFLLKAIILYGLLSAPFSVYDQGYGSFYRKLAGNIFGSFRGNGFVRFREWKEPATSHVNIGNVTQIKSDRTFHTAADNINTRYLGYIPTILIISLVLASPVRWKRKLIALPVGLILVTLLILFKQWIALLWMCDQNPWLNLTNFTGNGKTLLEFFNTAISVYSSTLLYFVVAVWILVTFRADDLRKITRITASTPPPMQKGIPGIKKTRPVA